MNAPKAIHNADNYVSACATRSVPWFLAATVAIHSADREMCKKGLMGCGPQKGYQDNLAAIERGEFVLPYSRSSLGFRSSLHSRFEQLLTSASRSQCGSSSTRKDGRSIGGTCCSASVVSLASCRSNGAGRGCARLTRSMSKAGEGRDLWLSACADWVVNVFSYQFVSSLTAHSVSNRTRVVTPRGSAGDLGG